MKPGREKDQESGATDEECNKNSENESKNEKEKKLYNSETGSFSPKEGSEEQVLSREIRLSEVEFRRNYIGEEEEGSDEEEDEFVDQELSQEEENESSDEELSEQNSNELLNMKPGREKDQEFRYSIQSKELKNEKIFNSETWSFSTEEEIEEEVQSKEIWLPEFVSRMNQNDEEEESNDEEEEFVDQELSQEDENESIDDELESSASEEEVSGEEFHPRKGKKMEEKEENMKNFKNKNRIVYAGPNPPPPLPPHFRNCIQQKSQRINEFLVIQKKFSGSEFDHEKGSRFSIPTGLIRKAFFSNGEWRGLNLNKKIPVKIIDPLLKNVSVNLKRRLMIKDVRGGEVRIGYILGKGWNDIVKGKNLEGGDVVQLWAVRVGGDLHFLFVNLSKEGGGDSRRNYIGEEEEESDEEEDEFIDEELSQEDENEPIDEELESSVSEEKESGEEFHPRKGKKMEEEEDMKNFKNKNRIVYAGPDPPPPLPPLIENWVEQKSRWLDEFLVFQTQLSKKEVDHEQRSHFFIRRGLIKKEFFSYAEQRELELNNQIPVKIIDPLLEDVSVDLQMTTNEPRIGYVLDRGWNGIVKGKNLEEGDIVQLWAVGVDRDMCFFLVKLPKEGGKDSSSDISDKASTEE